MASSTPSVGSAGPRDRALGRLRELIDFWGSGRLAATAVAALSVTAAGLWLLSPSRPPVEAAIPTWSPTVGSTEPGAGEPIVRVTVHVAGAVKRPGVYRLDAGSRVHEAIDAAGGPTAEADTDRVNLAAPLVDGAQVKLPEFGEISADWSDTEGPVNINSADAATLEGLPGIGPSLARAIIDERERSGPFEGVDDLDRVSGLGPVRIDALRDLVAT
jgi:competence protein ComEA